MNWFTIEVNGNIYEDCFGETYRFATISAAEEFIAEYEIDNAKIIKQF